LPAVLAAEIPPSTAWIAKTVTGTDMCMGASASLSYRRTPHPALPFRHHIKIHTTPSLRTRASRKREREIC